MRSFGRVEAPERMKNKAIIPANNGMVQSSIHDADIRTPCAA
jgi:hypothetical protein